MAVKSEFKPGARNAENKLVPLSRREFLTQSRFTALDGLRVFAIALVLRNHLPLQGTFWRYIEGGHGVTVFFVLSGFLITTLALREEARDGALNLQAFFVRRGARIFPAYYAVLLLYCALVFGGHLLPPDRQVSFRAALPYYVTYLNEFTMGWQPQVAFGQSWTLGLEEKFYLLWPLVAFLLLKRWPTSRLVICLLAIEFLALADSFLCLQYTALLCGCALALALNTRRGFYALAWLGSRWAHALVLVGFLVFLFHPAAFAARRSALFPFAVTAVLASVLLAEGPIVRAMSSNLARWIGDRSYGFYLLHVLCANAVTKIAGAGVFARWSIAIYGVTFLASLGAAHVLFVVIERPARELGRRWAAGWRPVSLLGQ